MKTKKKLRFKSMRRFFLSVVCILLVYASVTLVIQYGEYQKRSAELAEQQQKEAELRLEKQELQHIFDYTKTDQYIEYIARKTLGWVKPGERRYVED